MTVIIMATIDDIEIIFRVPPKRKARDVFLEVSACLNLHCGVKEIWYFGLVYFDVNNEEEIWLDTSKKSIKSFKVDGKRLDVRVKYYPEDVAQELIEEVTIRYFYLQVRSAIHLRKIYCPPDMCLLLASYAAQAERGDYSAKLYHKRFLRGEKILPPSMYWRYDMKYEDWEAEVMKLWQKHYGMLPEDAMLEYLKLAQNLEMYGVSYFDITNKKKTELLLGVNAFGLNVYKKEDRLNPIIAFSWSEIKIVNLKGTKFKVKFTKPHMRCFVFYSSNYLLNKHILDLCEGNHYLYIKRRRKDTFEVKKLKTKAAEKKRYKLKERSKDLAKKEAEKRELQYQTEINALKEDIIRDEGIITKTQLKIDELQEHIQNLQHTKQVLKEEQAEFKEVLEHLELYKCIEVEEKLKLETIIAARKPEPLRPEKNVVFTDEDMRKFYLERKENLRIEAERKLQEDLARREDIPIKKWERLPESASTELPSLVKINERLREDFKSLQEQLDLNRIESKQDYMDIIHMQNLKKGRDKYRTLNEIRKENTTTKIDMFENM